MRLGRRQLDVLRAANCGRAHVWHVGQGRMAVAGVDGVCGDDVLDRLLELGLVRMAQRLQTGHDLTLTEAGVRELERRTG